MRKWITVLLALCLLTGPALAEAPATAIQPSGETTDGTIRVSMESLGIRKALGLTLTGVYSVDGDRGFQFEPDTEIALGLDGGHVVLNVGGASIDMGGGFTLRRHLDADGGAGGAYIHESEKDTLYRGDIAISARNESLRVVVTLDIEEYLYGVVPYEMSDLFPIEALKAQAVAARTFAMQRKTRNTMEPHDVVDTANDQVFKGFDVRYERPIHAVDATRGIVGMVNGQYAECFYSASNGGQTALASDVWGKGEFPYLDMRDDPYDIANPDSIVKRAILTSDIDAMPEALHKLLIEALRRQLIDAETIQTGDNVSLMSLENVEAVSPIYGGDSRQYGTVRFTVQASVQRFVSDAESGFRTPEEPEDLADPVVIDLSFYDGVRQALGIGINASKYDVLSVDAVDGGFELVTRRSGHGVGLSQRGAQWMATEHQMGYQDILAFYYPGLTLVALNWENEPLVTADALPESLGYAAPRPTPAPTPAPLPPLEEGEVYATVSVEGIDQTLNVRETPSLDGAIMGKLRNGARLIIIAETEDGWAQMKTAELQGYVSMSFIVKEEP